MTARQRLLRTLFLSLIGLLVGCAIGWMSLQMDKPSGQKAAPVLNAAGIGGPYTLTDQNGVTRTEQDFAGRYKLIYFGFSYCPAICPTELQKTIQALNDLPDDLKQKVTPIFITVDPERDTVDTMKGYVELFDPRLVGLTGSVEQIEAAKKAYKVYAAKVPQDDTYTMDHSSFIYFMTPDDKLAHLFRTDDTAETMASTLRTYLAGS